MTKPNFKTFLSSFTIPKNKTKDITIKNKVFGLYLNSGNLNIENTDYSLQEKNFLIIEKKDILKLKAVENSEIIFFTID